MSEAERLRRHFSETYQNPQALGKASFQKEFDSILNDHINQKNRLHEDNIKMQKKNQEANSPKAIKKAKWTLYAGASLFFLITLPLLNSLVTKYKVEKEMEVMLKQQWEIANK